MFASSQQEQYQQQQQQQQQRSSTLKQTKRQRTQCSTLQKYAIGFVVLSLCLQAVSAAVFTQPAAYHPAYPGRCFDKITRRAMLPNKEYKPKGICAAMTCDLTTFTINIETCPDIEMPGCEELPTPHTWSFPKCCPQFKCTDFKTNKQFIVSV